LKGHGFSRAAKRRKTIAALAAGSLSCSSKNLLNLAQPRSTFFNSHFDDLPEAAISEAIEGRFQPLDLGFDLGGLRL
jgi:hypothetical protein